MVNYGLALSGGGTRGAAHIGVLAALEEEGLLPQRVAGTSAGSIAAGLYGSGMTVGDMKLLVRWFSRHGKNLLDPDIIGIIRFIPQVLTGREVSLRGLLKGKRLQRFLCELTGGMKLSEAPGKLLIPAVDLKSGNTVVFTNLFRDRIHPPSLQDEHTEWEREGQLCEIMMASSSVPAVFSPRHIKNWCLVDGGVTNNLPVDLFIAAGVKKVIAVDIGADYEIPKEQSVMEIASHSFTIMSRELKECRSKGELLLINPELNKGAGLLTFEYMEACMEEGYLCTKKRMEEIKKLLEA